MSNYERGKAGRTMNQDQRLLIARAIHKENDRCVRDGVEESWDSGYECACFQMADAAIAALAQSPQEAK